MKVASNFTFALASCASVRRRGFSTRSTLLRTRIFGARTSASLPRIISASSSRPRLASTMRQTRSASCAPPQAVVTMARSSRRFGAKMPGVSMSTSCACPTIAIPRRSARVVCTLGVTIATLVPTSALTSVDLPTLGAPMSAIIRNGAVVRRACPGRTGGPASGEDDAVSVRGPAVSGPPRDGGANVATFSRAPLSHWHGRQ